MGSTHVREVHGGPIAYYFSRKIFSGDNHLKLNIRKKCNHKIISNYVAQDKNTAATDSFTLFSSYVFNIGGIEDCHCMSLEHTPVLHGLIDHITLAWNHCPATLKLLIRVFSFIKIP